MSEKIEYIKTFRRATTLQPGNILIVNEANDKGTTQRNYLIKRVEPNGSEIRLLVSFFNECDQWEKEIILHDIDYVFIKLILV